MEFIDSQIMFGDNIIQYKLIIKNIKNINIRVNHSGNVLVSAPAKLPANIVTDYVKSKASWIYKSLEAFKKKASMTVSKEYVSGESFLVLGKQYRLKVIICNMNKIDIEGGYITLYTWNAESVEKRESQYLKWLREQAKEVFLNSFDKMYPLIGKYGYDKPELAIKDMRTRWGSCAPTKKKIWLNLHLIKAPVYCIDYVVLHELCHLKYPNHSRNFYDFLTALMPDWKERKKILEDIAPLDI